MTAAPLADRAIGLAERGWIPDVAVRWAIRRLCAQRLREQARRYGNAVDEETGRFIRTLAEADIAPVPGRANEQHYEVPTALFRLMLGPHMKYSCCWWDDRTAGLRDAESRSLWLTARHAGLADGQTILELGCGWGALTLWMAERYPTARISAVSNSAEQRRHIEAEAERRGLPNIEVTTADMNAFATRRRFDRVVSVEMFEHMRNYRALLERIHGWLEPDGRLFVHVFCHRRFAYLFEERGAADWMGRHFFSGGMMPSAGLLPAIPSRLQLEQRWRWDGTHYQRTADAWLERLDASRGEALAVLARAYGPDEAERWLGRWRIFLMACAELFGYAGGTEWGVAHYRFARAGAASLQPTRLEAAS